MRRNEATGEENIETTPDSADAAEAVTTDPRLIDPIDGDVHEAGLWGALKEVWREFNEDHAMTWAAALAFYSGLSLAPIVTVLAWTMRTVLGPEAKGRIVDGFAQVLGQEAAQPIGHILAQSSAQEGPKFSMAGLVSVGIIIFSATGVFAQLQAALNRMWDVRTAPTHGLIGFVRKRVLSFGMLFAILFLLVVSLAVSAGIQAFIGMGHQDQWWWPILTMTLSMCIFIPLFAVMYKYLPDVIIAWQDVWVGATLTALLFVLGKAALAFYLGRGSYESSYGAVLGSFLALLVWVYYSSVIFFLGAEATQVYARRHGHGIMPSKHAVRLRKGMLEDGV